MLGILFGTAILIAYIIFLFWITVKAMDSVHDGIPVSWSAAIAFSMWTFGIAMILYSAQVEDEKGPCLREETRMYWNSGAKVMMPAKVCIERGEWVKP